MSQVRTEQAKLAEVVGDPDFLAGFQSKLRGEEFPRVTPSWEWERGRMLAAAMGDDAQGFVGKTRWRPTTFGQLVTRFATEVRSGGVI